MPIQQHFRAATVRRLFKQFPLLRKNLALKLANTFEYSFHLQILREHTGSFRADYKKRLSEEGSASNRRRPDGARRAGLVCGNSTFDDRDRPTTDRRDIGGCEVSQSEQIVFRIVMRLLAAVYVNRQFGRPERNVMSELVGIYGSRRAAAAATILHTTPNPSRSGDCTDEHEEYGSYWQSLPFVTHTHSGEIRL